MTNAVLIFGVPKLLVTDRGRMFESAEFVTWINDLGCNIHHITAEMHYSNGQVERYLRTVLNMIRIEVNQGRCLVRDVTETSTRPEHYKRENHADLGTKPGAFFP